MKLIDVTNSYPELVQKQLENTDANFIQVFTLGKTTVVYTQAPSHKEILIINKQRNVNKNEIATVLNRFVDDNHNRDSLNIIELPGVVEISLPIDASVAAK